MNSKQESDLIKSIESAIEKKVNGKIDTIKRTLDNYIQSDMEWKKENEPALQNMKNLTGAGKVFLSIVLSLGAIASAWIAIKKAITPGL